jgi:hypothetical protein
MTRRPLVLAMVQVVVAMPKLLQKTPSGSPIVRVVGLRGIRGLPSERARRMPRHASDLGIVIDRSNATAQTGVGFDS